ncbi:diguanylate cyclase [Aliarcobacter faecis]|uniref:sensor domain-containing diguanylate cyclase n=1 Tax=Aliarcobacter faecis TaxID=1564138 RepID=UPI00047BFDF2|nr:sensor domain-containing diguanylate cyclase [Aliarcobacter faecis]QKF73194.1 diguanylate cyclase [Aliarcobacter faecis]
MYNKSKNYLLNLDVRNFFLEWIFLIFFLLALGIFVSFIIFNKNENILQREEERLSTQAKILNDNLLNQINSINQALLLTREGVERGDLEDKKSKEHLEEHIKMFIKVIPTLRTFVVLDKNGKVTATNRTDISEFNHSTKDYFLNVKNNPSRTKIYINTPYKTMLGTWTINLALMLNDEKGNFNGIVLAVFEPLELLKNLESVFYASDMRSSIIHGDGTLFLMAPQNDEALGKKIDSENSFLYKHKLGNKLTSVYKGTSYISNDERLVAFYTVKPQNIDIDSPLYITVSRDLNALYINIKNENYIVVVLMLILILSSVFGLFLLQKKRYFARLQEIEQDEEKRKILENYAYIDSLTEIANRRYFEQFLDKEWRYCQRNKMNLSIALIDIDNFKLYNDKYGHQTGDECLKMVARVLDDNLNRSHDFVARYGGEEFICILPNTNIENAEIICERLRVEVENLKILHEDSKTSNVVTISIGLSCIIPNEKIEKNDLIRKADNALYLSKKSGRNRVSIEL